MPGMHSQVELSAALALARARDLGGEIAAYFLPDKHRKPETMNFLGGGLKIMSKDLPAKANMAKMTNHGQYFSKRYVTIVGQRLYL
jgi:hypothetical protein